MPRPAWHDGGIRHLLLALVVGLALADSSIVTLALPPIIGELDASVEGAAAVLGVYTLVLAVALPLVRGPARLLACGGSVVFALASLGCGLVDSLAPLLVLRGVQAAGGAALLVGAFTLLDAGGAGRRLWTTAAVFGFAAGPALGGVLTEVLDWRAIFLVQVPVALVAAGVAAVRVRPPGAEAVRPDGAAARSAPDRVRSLVALALLSAALTGVLFLLVLLLVTGWSVSPLAAGAAVSVLPLAALAGARVRGAPLVRASAGAVLVAGGVLALASLPTASLAWTVLPQLMAGLGLGLALPALSGELIPERDPGEAARLLSIRHAGITVALALLAPLAASQLDAAVAETREKGAAIVLDARLPPLEKIELVDTLVGDLDPVDPRGELEAALAGARDDVDEENRAAYDDLAARADETVVAGVQSAFVPAFAICGVLALLAAVAVLPPRGLQPVAAAAVAALALAVGAYLAEPAFAPEPVTIASPCEDRDLPDTGGIDGALQDTALGALDRAACEWGSSREELALALVDDAARAEYEREHGVDPRDASGLLGAIIGLG